MNGNGNEKLTSIADRTYDSDIPTIREMCREGIPVKAKVINEGRRVVISKELFETLLKRANALTSALFEYEREEKFADRLKKDFLEARIEIEELCNRIEELESGTSNENC